jgi:phosphatidylglycerol---prolipoprotein diacylglyceryl transferase
MAGLPYIDVPQTFGPIKTFGLFLGAGLVLGTWMARAYCRRNGLDQDTLQWLGTRLIAWGLVGSVALNLVFYEWRRFVAHPWDVASALGISSFGAIVAGAIAFFYYTGKRGLDRRRWGDMAAWGAAGGWLIGRLGCAVAHDHVGVPTDFALGVDFPPMRYPFLESSDVIRAHDLGLYEFVLWIPLLVMVVALERRARRRPGSLLGALALAYSAPRFLLEFLRVEQTDPRYAGLTFAQWACIAAFAIGLQLLFGGARRDRIAAQPRTIP